MPRNRIRAAGFTLIELMFVVAVLAILAAIAGSASRTLWKGHRIRNVGVELTSSLILARSEAMKRNAQVTVTPVSATDWSRGWVVSAGGATVLSQSGIEGVVVTSGPASVAFTENGRLVGSTAAIARFQVDLVPSDAAYRRCIRLDLSGLPRSTPGAC